METVRRILEVLTWCGLAILIGTLYVKPHIEECTSTVRALSDSANASYSLWQGCRVEIAPGTWVMWKELPNRAPHLLKSPGCTEEQGTLCV
jgi:hypothetical protein